MSETTRVDFYILPDITPNGRELLACKLAEKAYLQGMRVAVRTNSAGHSQKLDELLWTFRDGSFVPHEIARANTAPQSPVVLSHEAASTSSSNGLLINLTDTIHGDFTAFDRVAELVDQDPNHLASSRVRFKHYREHGIEPNSHKL